MAKSSDLERVTIYWHAIPNENKRDPRGGWMPVIDHNGKQRGDTYGRGYDLETALQLAKEAAEEAASRYSGDWEIIVEPKAGAPGVSKVKRASKKAPKPPARSTPWGEVDTAADSLPWRNSYSNWTIRVGEAASRYKAPIAFGSETHDAWKAGVSPDAYAKARARR